MRKRLARVGEVREGSLTAIAATPARLSCFHRLLLLQPCRPAATGGHLHARPTHPQHSRGRLRWQAARNAWIRLPQAQPPKQDGLHSPRCQSCRVTPTRATETQFRARSQAAVAHVPGNAVRGGTRLREARILRWPLLSYGPWALNRGAPSSCGPVTTCRRWQ